MEADIVVAAMADVAAIVDQRRMVRWEKLGCFPSFDRGRKYEREGRMRASRLLPYPKGKVTRLLRTRHLTWTTHPWWSLIRPET